MAHADCYNYCFFISFQRRSDTSILRKGRNKINIVRFQPGPNPTTWHVFSYFFRHEIGLSSTGVKPNSQTIGIPLDVRQSIRALEHNQFEHWPQSICETFSAGHIHCETFSAGHIQSTINSSIGSQSIRALAIGHNQFVRLSLLVTFIVRLSLLVTYNKFEIRALEHNSTINSSIGHNQFEHWPQSIRAGMGIALVQGA